MKAFHRFAAFVIFGLLSLTTPMAAEAGLTFTATATSSSIFTNGGSTDIKVYLTSDASDNIGTFNIGFDITPDASNPSAPAGSLEFVSPANYLTDPTLINVSYLYNSNNPLFADNASSDTDFGQTFGIASDPGKIGFNTHFVGSDTYNGLDPNGYVIITPSTTVLVAYLVVTFNSPYTTNSDGDLFNITLNLSDPNTIFQDGIGGDPNATINNTDGQVLATVLVRSNQQPPVSLVPEPSTIWLALFTGISAVMTRVRRRKSSV